MARENCFYCDDDNAPILHRDDKAGEVLICNACKDAAIADQYEAACLARVAPFTDDADAAEGYFLSENGRDYY